MENWKKCAVPDSGPGQMDEAFMRRAVELAERGCGRVSPNPLVGAVIVKEGRVIGEGWHARCGDLHAERAALRSCREPAAGASMYVTLEPCCHKGVLREACEAQNRVFFHYIRTGLPYVVLKYAMTMDGKIATAAGASRWITGEEARRRVHEDRGRYTAIMAGSGTVKADDPQLTCRIPGGRDPIRVLCDSRLTIPQGAKVIVTAGDVRTILATCCGERERLRPYRDAGCEILTIPEKDGRLDLRELMQRLGKMGIDSILAEGGATLNGSLLQSGMVNWIQAYIAPKIFGGETAPSPVGGSGAQAVEDAAALSLASVTRLGDDLLVESEVKRCLQGS